LRPADIASFCAASISVTDIIRKIPGIGFCVTTACLFLLLRFKDLLPWYLRRLEWIVLRGGLEARA
jgi:hypothetical protein